MEKINENSVLNAGILPELEHKTVQIGSHSISYDILQGSPNPERTVIFCHGAFASRHVNRVLAEKLANHRKEDRLILVDVPWHGDSTSELPNDEPSVHTYAKILGEWLETLKANGTIQGKLAWFGWSMGGSIGLLLDLDGKSIDELVLVNSAPYWETLENIVKAVPALADPATTRAVFKGVMTQDFETGVSDKEREDLLSHYDSMISGADVMVQDLQAISTANYDIREDLPNIKAKTLIVSGTKDALATIELQDLMFDGIPEATVHIGSESHSALLTQHEADIIISSYLELFVLND